MNHHIASSARRRGRHAAGFTLVELMVAMALGILIALAAVSALYVARQGMATVDATSQLRDQGRFAAELIQRVTLQAGFRDWSYAALTQGPPVANAATPANPDPDIMGFDNAVVTSPADPLSTLASGTRDAAAGGCNVSTDTACVNGSDVLVIRYQSSLQTSGAATLDGAMINCAGDPQTTPPVTGQDRMVSIFHVARAASGQPTLMCTASVNGATSWRTVPLVEGVEGFQVLYGTDAVTPNTAPTQVGDEVADQYLTAAQMVVPGNAVATNANWRRVRTIRVALLLRGPVGSAQDRTAATASTYPMSPGAPAAPAAADMAIWSSTDAGSKFDPPADARLRQAVTFTAHLRNHPNVN